MDPIETPVVQPLPEDFTAFKAARQGTAQPAALAAESKPETPAEQKPAEEALPAAVEKTAETAPASEPGKNPPREPKEEGKEVAKEGQPEDKGNKAFAAMRKALRATERRTQEIAERNQDLERQLNELRAGKPTEAAATPEPKPADGEPQPEDFDDYDKYLRAITRYQVKQELQQAETERTLRAELERNTAINRQRQQVAEAWVNRLDEAVEKHEDFEDVLRSSQVPMSETAMKYIVDPSNPHGAELAYHLATHPEEAKNLLRYTDSAQVEELGRIVQVLRNPPAAVAETKPVSKAPKPPSVVGGGAAPVVDSVYDEKTANDYTKWKAARQRQLAQR
jgi:hypothetical protein